MNDDSKDEKREDDEEFEKTLEAIEGMRTELKRQNRERFASEMRPIIMALIAAIAFVLFSLFLRQ